MTPQPAFLLHRKPYRETSAMIELLTLDHGRVRAIARGVQRPGSKSRSRLQPFTPLHVTWRGESDLKTLNLMETGGSASLLAGEGLLCGFYANELLTRTLPVEMPVPQLFALYSLTLDEIALPAKRAPALRRLEYSLLEALEQLPQFRTLEDDVLAPDMRYDYVVSERRFRAQPAGAPGIEGRALKLLASEDWGHAGLARETLWLARRALAPLLGNRPLRSRELMMQLTARRRESRQAT
ncbi:DNA repair protein RecO [Cobetia sp. L2A1]|uniref:DNA repair protein RecO n=1 Tax=Cobetia sp. L2A1 TaxID=2686360 RepID=UPI00131B637A|nr:DNA repair protein RecO [Cobetia sp. L2A1]